MAQLVSASDCYCIDSNAETRTLSLMVSGGCEFESHRSSLFTIFLFGAKVVADPAAKLLKALFYSKVDQRTVRNLSSCRVARGSSEKLCQMSFGNGHRLAAQRHLALRAFLTCPLLPCTETIILRIGVGFPRKRMQRVGTRVFG